MASIIIQGSSGLKPRIDSKLLRSNEAVTADNCDFTGGAIKSIRVPFEVKDLAKTGGIKSIYLFNGTTWLHWNEDVDVVRSPVANNTNERTYFTGTDALRVTDSNMVDIATALTGNITNATQANPIVITSTSHGLFTGAKLTIQNVGGMTELNGNTYTITVIDSDTFSLDGVDGTGYTAYTSGGDWSRIKGEYPEDSYIAGVPAPTTAPAATLVGTHSTPQSVAYVYTFVNAWGEESAPSPASNVVDADFSTGSVDLTSMDQAPTGDYVPISKWRIYRVASGTSGAEYLFVAEITINSSSPQYNDSILTSNLGEAIQTTDWEFPDSNMIGLTMMGNGIMAGFYRNQVYFSEPFVPYAYPSKYRVTVDEDIVGLGAFGNSLVVVTKRYPYVMTGTYPSQVSVEKIVFRQPGVSKRSIVSVVGGVIWATPSGLFYLGQDGANLITRNHYTREQWTQLGPENMVAGLYDEKYIAYSPTAQKAIMFVIKEGLLSEVVTDMDAIYAEPSGDELYYCDEVGGVNKLYKFDGGGTKETFTFKSKIFISSGRILITAGRVDADYASIMTAEEIAALQAQADAIKASNQALLSDPLGELNDSEINTYAINGDALQDIPSVPSSVAYTLKLYYQDSVIFTTQVDSSKPFRIKLDKRYTEFQVEVSGQYPIQSIRLATSIEELMRVA